MARLGQFRSLPQAARTVAECFHDAGYATASVVNVDFLTTSFGLTQGFEHVDFEVYPNNVQLRSATRTTDAAVSWLKARPKRPFFMLVHYFDPHVVYAPPAEYRRRFAAAEDRDNTDWIFGTRQQIVGYRQGQLRLDEATVKRAEKLYNGEVAYTDHEVGRLLDALAELGLAVSTVVVFTADHGEEFFDHGGFEHGHTLYDELLHVPLLIRYPERLKPRVVAGPVGLVDVAPTLCALSGVAADPAFVGQNLSQPDGAAGLEERPLILEGNFWGRPHRGWLHDGYKLIVSGGGMKLFNLRNDPAEQIDLRTIEVERLRKMTADMAAAFKAMAARALDQSSPVQVSPEELKRLRSLGYVP